MCVKLSLEVTVVTWRDLFHTHGMRTAANVDFPSGDNVNHDIDAERLRLA